MYCREGKNYIRGKDLLPGGTYRDPYGEDCYSFVYPEKEFLLQLTKASGKVQFECVLGDVFSEKELASPEQYWEQAFSEEVCTLVCVRDENSKFLFPTGLLGRIRCLLRLLEVRDQFSFRYPAGEIIREEELDAIQAR